MVTVTLPPSKFDELVSVTRAFPLLSSVTAPSPTRNCRLVPSILATAGGVLATVIPLPVVSELSPAMTALFQSSPAARL